MKNLKSMVRGMVVAILLGAPSIALAAAEPFIGEIMMTGANFCPRGWANADGQLLPINQNQALFSLLGTTYGGDGRTTLGLPDMRGRVPLHVGQGSGLTDRRQGSKGGEENHALNIPEMPQHQHVLNASKEGANQSSPTGNLLANQSRKSRMYVPSAANALTPMHATAIGTTGSSRPHNTMQPFLGIRFCIALQGVFPSRN
ncbi:MAG: tail fiber protein [Nitrospirota bacterium]|nr:tail fiber protein [Nitrospirota bacterium]MDH5585222.1 tail fiber protein [Nitrospirota bacterium]MDH5774809.1 tail fiber protein [Nitrospirota bacterium]